MENYCSPKNKDNVLTCFSNQSLVKIAKKYNSRFSDKISIPETIDSKKREILWKEIKEKIKSPCDKDYCLLYNRLIKEINDKEINDRTFRPEMPESWLKNHKTWLSTIDIMKVMKQYQDKHSDFKFIGPTPIDFEKKLFMDTCVSDDICNMDLSDLYTKGKRKLGIVINLDPHYKGGSHWVGVYMDINKGGIYFFDSYGIKPKKEIYDLMEKLKIQGNSLIEKDILDINTMGNDHTRIYEVLKIEDKNLVVKNGEEFFKNDLCFLCDDKTLECKKENMCKLKEINDDTLTFTSKLKYKPNLLHKSFKCYFNPNRFQYENSECGVYSMHFIEEFLKGGTFEDIISKIYNDHEMNKKRKYYYRPNILS